MLLSSSNPRGARKEETGSCQTGKVTIIRTGMSQTRLRRLSVIIKIVAAASHAALWPDDQIAGFPDRAGAPRATGNEVAGVFDGRNRIGRAGGKTNPGEQTQVYKIIPHITDL